jgi:uncharacterized membrane protein YdjX (TVP38/TMEM64 family)
MRESEKSKHGRAKRPRRSASKLTWAVPVLVVGALVGLYFLWPAYRDFLRQAYEVLASEDQAQIESWVRGYDPWGWVVLVGLMILQTVVVILPSVGAMAASVLAYGPFVGGALAWGGMLLAAAIAYAMGRALGPVTVEKLIGARSREKLEKAVERYGLWAVIIARLSPILSTDAVSIVAGLVQMRFWRFMAATAAGTLPLIVLIAALGTNVDRLETGLIVISAVSLAIFIGYVVWDRWRGARAEKSSDRRSGERARAT